MPSVRVSWVMSRGLGVERGFQMPDPTGMGGAEGKDPPLTCTVLGSHRRPRVLACLGNARQLGGRRAAP